MTADRRPVFEGTIPQVRIIDINGVNPQITNIRGVTPQPSGGSIQGGVQPQHTPTTGQGVKPPAHE